MAAIALIVTSPLLLFTAICIKVFSRGPIFYHARRVGRGNSIFTMYKFRTMHVAPASDGTPGAQSAITAHQDPRVFRLGAWLRRLKIDELPQLINILKGEMAFVGPRPEDPRIVAEFYAAKHYETLGVLPGLTSPGSIYSYTHGEKLLTPDNPERDYVERLLPIKLALDTVYVREISLGYDVRIILRTLLIIARIALGQREFPNPPEMHKARQLMISA